MNEPTPDPKLEQAAHTALRRLPLQRAPDTLLPRVLDTLAARAARPWWHRAWWEWPLSARIAFAVAGLCLVIAASSGGWWIDTRLPVGELETLLQVPSDSNPPAWRETLAVWSAGLVTWWQDTGQKWWMPGLIALAALYLFCLGAGTWLVRLVLTPAASPLNRDRSVRPPLNLFCW